MYLPGVRAAAEAGHVRHDGGVDVLRAEGRAHGEVRDGWGAEAAEHPGVREDLGEWGASEGLMTSIRERRCLHSMWAGVSVRCGDGKEGRTAAEPDRVLDEPALDRV
jgi:hypothetical protein